MVKVIVTGSPDWKDYGTIHGELAYQRGRDGQAMLLTTAMPGAETLAALAAVALHFHTIRRYPPRPGDGGDNRGRNRTLLTEHPDAGALLAFYTRGQRHAAALDMMRRARKLGIPTHHFTREMD